MSKEAARFFAQINTARDTWLARVAKVNRTALEITLAFGAQRLQCRNSLFDFGQMFQSFLNQLFGHPVFFCQLVFITQRLQ